MSAALTGEWELLLRDLDRNGVHTCLWARLDADGNLHIEGQDLGVPPGLVSNDDEYEYFHTIRAEDIPKLIELLGGDPGDDLRDVLGLNWTDADSFELEKRLRDAPFEIAFYSC